MAAEAIVCRSAASESCYHGKPADDIYGAGGAGMAEDSTYDGESVVCDACYIAIGQPTASDPATIAGGKGRGNLGR